MAAKLQIYLEKGQKRIFAGALEWPGWCRSGPNEEAALQALIDYAPRYTKAIKAARATFKPPKDASSFEVVEVLKGDSTTDFGAPHIAPSFDSTPATEAELKRLIALLESCWTTFDEVSKRTVGKKLTTGPRGGGRDLMKMRRHVVEADLSYLTQVGRRFKPESKDIDAEMKRMRKPFVDALIARNRGELPATGPRGGKRWTARYAIRRSAWHVLDHAWELEDRAGL